MNHIYINQCNYYSFKILIKIRLHRFAMLSLDLTQFPVIEKAKFMFTCRNMPSTVPSYSL